MQLLSSLAQATASRQILFIKSFDMPVPMVILSGGCHPEYDRPVGAAASRRVGTTLKLRGRSGGRPIHASAGTGESAMRSMFFNGGVVGRLKATWRFGGPAACCNLDENDWDWLVIDSKVSTVGGRFVRHCSSSRPDLPEPSLV